MTQLWGRKHQGRDACLSGFYLKHDWKVIANRRQVGPAERRDATDAREYVIDLPLSRGGYTVPR